MNPVSNFEYTVEKWIAFFEDYKIPRIISILKVKFPLYIQTNLKLFKDNIHTENF